jgi:hypothetical protein
MMDALLKSDKGWQMLNQIFEFFKFLYGLYIGLTPEQKAALKQLILDAFDAVLRAFFRSESQGKAA